MRRGWRPRKVGFDVSRGGLRCLTPEIVNSWLRFQIRSKILTPIDLLCDSGVFSCMFDSQSFRLPCLRSLVSPSPHMSGT